MKKMIFFFVAGLLFVLVGEIFLYQISDLVSSSGGFMMMGIGAALVYVSIAINMYRKRNFLSSI